MATLNNSEIAAMRETVSNTQLDHLCTIQRRTQTGTDPNGAPIYSWANVLVDEPCHFWESSEEELVGNENALLTRRRLVLKANRGVVPDDRVTKLVGYDDKVYENDFNILHVLDRVNETVCMLEEIS